MTIKVGAGIAAGSSSVFGAARVLKSLPPDHGFYALIGRVAAEGARLEHNLDLIIWELTGLDHKLASCITAGLGSSYARFQAIQALAAAKGASQDLLLQIRKLCDSTSQVLKSRHRFVHDAWYDDGGEHPSQFKSYTAKDGKFGFHEITEADALETIRVIQNKTAEIGKLRTALQKLR